MGPGAQRNSSVPTGVPSSPQTVYRPNGMVRAYLDRSPSADIRRDDRQLLAPLAGSQPQRTPLQLPPPHLPPPHGRRGVAAFLRGFLSFACPPASDCFHG